MNLLLQPSQENNQLVKAYILLVASEFEHLLLRKTEEIAASKRSRKNPKSKKSKKTTLELSDIDESQAPKSSMAMLAEADVAKVTADNFLVQAIECFTKVFGEDHSSLADIMTTASALKVSNIDESHAYIHHDNSSNHYIIFGHLGELRTLFRRHRMGWSSFGLKNRDSWTYTRKNCG